MSRMFSRKTLIVALVATAMLGGGVAFAYPPGTKLTVTATAAPSGGATKVLVSIQNANPTCATKIEVEGGATVIFPAGTTTGEVTIPAGTGRRRVEARTVDCPKGSKEHAHSNFSILNAHATVTGSNSRYEVEYTGLDAKSTVTATATRSGSSEQVVKSGNVDNRGEATIKIRLRTAGTWVITSVISPPGTGSVGPVTVVVP